MAELRSHVSACTQWNLMPAKINVAAIRALAGLLTCNLRWALRVLGFGFEGLGRCKYRIYVAACELAWCRRLLLLLRFPVNVL